MVNGVIALTHCAGSCFGCIVPFGAKCRGLRPQTITQIIRLSKEAKKHAAHAAKKGVALADTVSQGGQGSCTTTGTNPHRTPHPHQAHSHRTRNATRSVTPHHQHGIRIITPHRLPREVSKSSRNPHWHSSTWGAYAPPSREDHRLTAPYSGRTRSAVTTIRSSSAQPPPSRPQSNPTPIASCQHRYLARKAGEGKKGGAPETATMER